MTKFNKYLTLIVVAICASTGNIFAQTTDMTSSQLPAGPTVDIKTTVGDIKVRLYDDTPLHRDNFIKLATDGFYDGVLFHRVINDFMVQTGDPNSKNATPDSHLGAGDPGYTIDAEIDYPRHFHKYGALAAARTPDNVNPEKKSSGSQFYIVTGKKYDRPTLQGLSRRMADKSLQAYFRQLTIDHKSEIQAMQAANDTTGLENLRQELIRQTEANVRPEGMPEDVMKTYETVGGTPFLDGDYTVFGEVISGMDTVEKIQKAATDPADRPKEDIKIISVKVEK